MRVLSIKLLVVFLLLVGPGLAQADESRFGPLRVMTQNLYIGADVTGIVNTTDITQIPFLVHQAFARVAASDFPSRARAFAEQVKDARPDVIGLQEVSLIRVQPQSDFFAGNPQLATEVRADYLQTVLQALEEKGLHYKVAGIVNDIDQELPAYGDLNGTGTPTLYDLRLTDRDVILVRKRVDVSNVSPLNYTYNIYYTTPAGDISYTRGAIAVDAHIRGGDYRLVNTHLEVRYSDDIAIIQSLQMQELLGLLAGETRPLVLMGDMNSSPLDTPDTLAGLPTPYQQTQLAGYTDVWLQGGKGDGYTCCHSEMLDNPDEAQTVRIDYIFTRNFDTAAPLKGYGKVRAYTFSELTDSGIWYSDHDGLFASINIPYTHRHREKEEGHRHGH